MTVYVRTIDINMCQGWQLKCAVGLQLAMRSIGSSAPNNTQQAAKEGKLGKDA